MAMQYLEFPYSNGHLSPYLLLLPGPKHALRPVSSPSIQLPANRTSAGPATHGD